MSRLTDFFPGGAASQDQNALLIMVGGGGGAGIGATYCSGTAGGDILCTFLNLKTGVTCPITVGAGGAAGCVSPTCVGQPGGAGGNGGYSSFGELRAPGGGGTGTTLTTVCCCCGPGSPYSPAPANGYNCTTYPAIARGGIGGCYTLSNQTRMLRALPLSYPGFVGTLTRAQGFYTFGESPSCCKISYINTLNSFNTNPTIIESVAIVKACTQTIVAPTPYVTGQFCTCKVVCSRYYNVELGNQPYGYCYGPSASFPCCLFDVGENSLGCSRYSIGCYVPCGPLGCCPIRRECMAIPNNPNTGHGGRVQSCNGDSGVVVLFYPTAIAAASSFPGGIDCTPVSCPFGMRAYKFTSSGSITI